MSGNAFPDKAFRFEHAYKIDEPLGGFPLDKHNILAGVTGADISHKFWLGRLAEFTNMDVNVWIDTAGAHAIYVMGKRRSGKTFTLGALVEGLAGIDGFSTGATGQAVVVLDTMNVFLASGVPAMRFDAALLQQWGLSDPSNIPFHLYYPAGSPPPPSAVQAESFSVPAYRFSAEDWCELFELDPFASPMGQLLAESVDLCATSGFTVDGNAESATLYDLDRLAYCVERADELLRYDPSTRRALSRRLQALEQTGLFSGKERLFLQAGTAAIFLLRDIAPELRRLLVNYLATQILRGRSETESCERVLPLVEDESERQMLQQRISMGVPRTWLIIDEAHNYIPATGGGKCRKTLNRYVTEGRNLGLSIVVATQHPSALDPALKRNADMLLIHTLSMSEDVDVAVNMLTTAIPAQVTFDNRKFPARGPGLVDAIRSLPQGYCFMSSDTLQRVAPVVVRPRVTYHGGNQY